MNGCWLGVLCAARCTLVVPDFPTDLLTFVLPPASRAAITNAVNSYAGKLAALAVQKTQLQYGRLRRKQRRLEAQQRREREREEWELKFAREAGYTLDGVRFFKTSKALREWCDEAAQVRNWIGRPSRPIVVVTFVTVRATYPLP